MPSRNTIRFDLENSFYHVYARGSSKRRIFLDEADYTFFISLFSRYLSEKPAYRKQGDAYPHLHNEVQLIAFCLMPNHFHLYVYQKSQGSLSLLMRGLMTSYSRYFNTKYKQTGSLYENRYKSSIITNDSYNTHISRYIHMNPRYWRFYRYSSLPYYLSNSDESWLNTSLVLGEFASPAEYLEFLQDYEENNSQIDEVKSYLADR